MGQSDTILIVDDEKHISAMTKEFLVSKGFEVDLIHEGVGAIKQLNSKKYDLCLLDINMPIKDGYSVAKEIKDAHHEVPIIFLTGKTETEDRIKGLKIGAQDYITKPYSLEELHLRMENILDRFRNSMITNTKLRIADWEFDVEKRILSNGFKKSKLSGIEAKLLYLLITCPSNFLSKDKALREIWNDEYRLKENSLKVYISKLRKYFAADGNVDIINEHGLGYRLIASH